MEQKDSSKDDTAASLFVKVADVSCVHAVASIFTAVIVEDETHNNMYYRNNRQIPAKQKRCMSTPPQTAGIITDVESGGLGFYVCVFSQHQSQTCKLWKLLVFVGAGAVERTPGKPTSQSSHAPLLFFSFLHGPKKVGKKKANHASPPAAAAVCAEPVASGEWWKGRRTWAGNVIMDWRTHPGSLLQWRTTLWPENAPSKNMNPSRWSALKRDIKSPSAAGGSSGVLRNCGGFPLGGGESSQVLPCK